MRLDAAVGLCARRPASRWSPRRGKSTSPRRSRPGAGRQFLIDAGERIVERVHEDAAHHVDDEDPAAVLGFDQVGAAARRARRVVGRADQPRLALDIDQRLALIERMVAERHRVGARIDQLLADRFGDAETARRVLADDDDAENPMSRRTAATATTAAGGVGATSLAPGAGDAPLPATAAARPRRQQSGPKIWAASSRPTSLCATSHRSRHAAEPALFVRRLVPRLPGKPAGRGG